MLYVLNLKFLYTLLSASSVLFLSACQTTTNTNQNTHQQNQFVNIASFSDINQAILADPNIDVLHPIEDVEFTTNIEESLIEDDIWQRIRNDFSFNIPENPRLIAQRDWYAKHPTYINRIVKRAEPFLHYIVEELEANDIPLEVALLPVVESAFDPFAYSHSSASGMWQFMPATGTRFGMNQDWWYDGRRDVIDSTQGAIAYLKYLNKFFDGDWLLALAAYNSGEGRVQRAVRKNAKLNKPTDFWSLDLPKETQAYVPKLLALADIIKRPEALGVKLKKIENTPVISIVDIGSQLDLSKAAGLSQITLAELQRLNAGFNRWSTSPNGPHRIVIPSNKRDVFVSALAKLSKDDRLSWNRYKVKSGDSLNTIASKFKTTVGVIKNVNDLSSSNIRTGKYLLIPNSPQSFNNKALKQYRSANNSPVPTKIKNYYTVKSGDTLWDISRMFNVSTSQVAKWNKMSKSDTLSLGKKLIIWQESTNTKKSLDQSVTKNITYKVRKGDSFARIADKFNLRIKDIEQWNNLNRSKYLQPGQKLKLAVDIKNNI